MGGCGSGLVAWESVRVPYRRAPDLVWRLTTDRVLVRRVGDRTEHAAGELLGGAALVWVAAEEWCTIDEIASDTELPVDVAQEAADLLLAANWIEAGDPPPAADAVPESDPTDGGS